MKLFTLPALLPGIQYLEFWSIWIGIDNNNHYNYYLTLH